MAVAIRHPWDRWFCRGPYRDRGPFRRVCLRRIRDYDCMPHSMAVQIRNAAAARGLHVSVRIEEDVITVTPLRRRRKKGAA